MFQEIWDDVPEHATLFAGYIILVIVYLVKLDSLNKVLLRSYNKDDVWNIISHNNNQPLWYIVGAIVFYIFAIWLIIYFFRTISRVGAAGSIFLLLSIICIIVSLIVIWNFINNPILRAFLIILGIGGVILGVSSSQA